MESIAQEMRFPIDLRGGLMEQPQRGKLMRGDKNAAVVIAELYDGEKPYEGNDVTVTGKFSRKGDGIDIQLDGKMENGAAMVTLDEHCFAVSVRAEGQADKGRYRADGAVHLRLRGKRRRGRHPRRGKCDPVDRRHCGAVR